MGCCVSSNNRALTTSSQRKNHDSVVAIEKTSENRAPSQTEEETVKEVLSETPKRNPTAKAKSELQKPHKNVAFDKFQEEEESKVEKKALPINKAEEENISEVSEACSMNETMYTTTITDEGEETRKRVIRSHAKMQKNRSFPGDLGGNRERMVAGTRNAGSVRLAKMSHKMGHERGITRNQPRRKDAGDNSFRQFRSPATGADNGASGSVMGRSPSARRINRSAARVGTSLRENGCRNMGNPTVKGESLENPLVSLECFIFI